MRVAVVAESFSVRSGTRAPLEIAQALARRGHAVTFYARTGGSEDGRADAQAAGVTITPLLKDRSRAVKALSQALANDRPEVTSLHTTLPFALAVRTAGVPAVATYYGTPVDIATDRLAMRPTRRYALLDRLARRLALERDRRMLTSAGRAVAISKACADAARAAFGLELPVVPLGTRARIAPSARPARPRLLSVSRFVPSKGFHVLLHAWRKLRPEFPDLGFDVVGTPANRGYLRYLRSAFPEAEFHVDLPEPDLELQYRRAAIYVTADRNLFFGLPVLEAAASGVPAVAFDYAAAREVIRNEQTGYVVGTAADFAARVAGLLRDPALRVRFGAAARQYAIRWTWEATARALEPHLARAAGVPS